MPKERLHLLLADLTLQRMDSSSGCSPIRGRWKTAFLHGAVAPDLFFYDLPRFRLAGVGSRLHDVMTTAARSGAIPEPMLDILETPCGVRNRPWFLGMAHHFMVDLGWHPLINGYGRLRDTPCRRFGLGMRDCHHWLESELESYWLGRLGPPDGYIPLLRQLKRKRAFRESISTDYRELLAKLEIVPTPSAPEITRCSTLQILLMLELANPMWARLKRILLSMEYTKYIGALIAPRYPPAEGEFTNTSDDPTEIQKLWEPQFVDETVDSIATQFLSLPGWS